MPHFVMVQGGLGAGKTLSAATLAHYWRLKSGGDIRIFSNFDLAESTPFKSVNNWLDIADARGSIILWDEAQNQFDRRNWSRNTWMSQIFNMTRKLRAVHVFMQPVGMNLDGRILDLVEIMINVTKLEGRSILLDLFEFQDKRFGPNGRYLKTLKMNWTKVRQIQRLELYDTDQLVYPFPTPKTERDQIDLMKEIIDRQQEAVKRERSGIQVGGDLSGWINPSDRHRQRDLEREQQELEEEESAESSLFLPEYEPGEIQQD